MFFLFSIFTLQVGLIFLEIFFVYHLATLEVTLFVVPIHTSTTSAAHFRKLNFCFFNSCVSYVPHTWLIFISDY